MKTIIYFILTAVLFNTVNVCFAEDKKDDAAELLVKGNTEFAFDLYAQLKEQDGNLFFSPHSISTALAMTYAGARNETAEQMAQTLHFPKPVKLFYTFEKEQRIFYAPDASFHNEFGQLINQLNKQGQKGDYQLSIANALWGQQDYPFLSSFIKLNHESYRAGLANVDFVKETEKSRLKINQWVEDQTQEKIKDLIPKGALDEATRLVLTNAIYFKGNWKLQFDIKQTKNEPFYITSEKTVTAPLMFQKEKLKYGQTDMIQLLELPYKGDDLSMVVLLPKQKDGLAELEKQLTTENLAEWQKQMRKREVEVFLPKFKMTSQFSLKETLSAMGMPDAFDESNADFSGMTGTKDLFISAVVHKAFVDVNEEGTEAAAATGVMISTTSVEITPPPVFRADHPFVFIIKDNNTQSILFVGRVTDPTKEE